MTDIANDREAAEVMFYRALKELRSRDPESEVIELYDNRRDDVCTEENLRRFGNHNFAFPVREKKTLVAHIYAGRYLAATQALAWSAVRAEQEAAAVSISKSADLLDRLGSAIAALAEIKPKHELIELFRDRSEYPWFRQEIDRRFRFRVIPYAKRSTEPDGLCYAMMLQFICWEIRRIETKQAA